MAIRRNLRPLSNRPVAAQPPAQVEKYGTKEYFTYSIRLQNLTAGATGVGQFTVDAGCDFMWTKATMLAVDDGGAVSNQYINATFTLIDAGTGRNLTNIPIPVDSIFGSGQLPFILPTPKLFAARASVNLNVVNNSATNYTNFYFNFIGTQLFLN